MRLPRIVRRKLRELNDFEHNPRQHSKRQIRQLAKIIQELEFIGFIVIDEQGRILAGHARRQAALLAGMEEVDCLVVEHLSEAQKRAFMLADNKMGLESTWDIEKVQIVLDQIHDLDLDFDLSLTGFDSAEIDQLSVELAPQSDGPSPRDEAVPEPKKGPTVAQPGDLIACGRHLIFCGDALDAASYDRLLGGSLAAQVISDPPYNVAIPNNVSGNGKVRHGNFAMASGEMSSAAFTGFLKAVFTHVARHSVDGSIHSHFMDWRHVGEMHAAGSAVYSELKNIIVWDKGVGGQGAFYRSQHELIFVFKNGTAPHQNNFGLGAGGRYRTNVWKYRGLNTGGRNRLEELAMHPTVKPVQMLADAMLDCSSKGDLVLDPFGGSGSTLIAAQKVGRRARLIEIDPRYVDVMVRRWQAYTREDAIFVDTAETFEEREARLCREPWVVRPGRRPTSRLVNFAMEIRS